MIPKIAFTQNNFAIIKCNIKGISYDMILRKNGFPQAETPGEIELIDEIQKYIKSLKNHSTKVYPNVKLGKWSDINGLVSIELKNINDSVKLTSISTTQDINNQIPTLLDEYQNYKELIKSYPNNIQIAKDDNIEIVFKSEPQLNITINLSKDNKFSMSLSYLFEELSKWFKVHFINNDSLYISIENNSEHDTNIIFPRSFNDQLLLNSTVTLEPKENKIIPLSRLFNPVFDKTNQWVRNIIGNGESFLMIQSDDNYILNLSDNSPVPPEYALVYTIDKTIALIKCKYNKGRFIVNQKFNSGLKITFPRTKIINTKNAYTNFDVSIPVNKDNIPRIVIIRILDIDKTIQNIYISGNGGYVVNNNGEPILNNNTVMNIKNKLIRSITVNNGKYFYPNNLLFQVLGKNTDIGLKFNVRPLVFYSTTMKNLLNYRIGKKQKPIISKDSLFYNTKLYPTFINVDLEEKNLFAQLTVDYKLNPKKIGYCCLINNKYSNLVKKKLYVNIWSHNIYEKSLRDLNKESISRLNLFSSECTKIISFICNTDFNDYQSYFHYPPSTFALHLHLVDNKIKDKELSDNKRFYYLSSITDFINLNGYFDSTINLGKNKHSDYHTALINSNLCNPPNKINLGFNKFRFNPNHKQNNDNSEPSLLSQNQNSIISNEIVSSSELSSS